MRLSHLSRCHAVTEVWGCVTSVTSVALLAMTLRASVRPFVCSSARRKSLRKTTNRQNDETTKRTVARALMPPSVRLLIRPSTRRKSLRSSVNSARAFALQQFFPATLNYFTIFLLYLPMNIHSCRWGVRTTRVRATTTATRTRGVTQWLLTVNTLFLK